MLLIHESTITKKGKKVTCCTVKFQNKQFQIREAMLTLEAIISRSILTLSDVQNHGCVCARVCVWGNVYVTFEIHVSH